MHVSNDCIINFNSGIGICVKYRDVGIATGVLAFFVVNIVLYLFIYCVIKVSDDVKIESIIILIDCVLNRFAMENLGLG